MLNTFTHTIKTHYTHTHTHINITYTYIHTHVYIYMTEVYIIYKKISLSTLSILDENPFFLVTDTS